MKVVFMGTPDFAVNVLEGLVKEKYDVRLVVSQPDKLVGRKKELKATPVKECALKHGIEVFQPVNIKKDYQRILDVNPDIIITCAYGQIVPKILLETPKYKAINVHASLLPKLRGGAPIHKAIIYGHDKTGVTIMYMAPKMDAGDIISQEETPILETDNLESIHDKLSILGTNLLLKTLPLIEIGNINPIQQDESLVTYAYNVSRAEEYVDFSKTTKEVYDQIRGLNPWPVSYSTINQTNIKIYQAQKDYGHYEGYQPKEIISLDKTIKVKTCDGAIDLIEIQVEGKKRCLVKDFLNGQKIMKKHDLFQ